MKPLFYLLRFTLLIVLFIVTQLSVQADTLYKWKDARGNIQYGDRPPAHVNAKPIDAPKITVISNYADQWKPMKFDKRRRVSEPTVKKTVSTYTSLSFLAPKANQAIRANDGDVSAIISLKPPLKKGHQIEYVIDGKSAGKGNSRTKNFSDLTRGNHTIAVNIIDRQGKVTKNNSVTFSVVRSSKFSNSSSEGSVAKNIRSFNDVRKEQLSN